MLSRTTLSIAVPKYFRPARLARSPRPEKDFELLGWLGRRCTGTGAGEARVRSRRVRARVSFMVVVELDRRPDCEGRDGSLFIVLMESSIHTDAA